MVVQRLKLLSAPERTHSRRRAVEEKLTAAKCANVIEEELGA
jgi:hypothetical protein